MSIKYNDKDIKQLLELTQSPLWDAYEKMLQKEYKATLEALLNSTDPHIVYRNQGKACFLAELLEFKPQVRKDLERIEAKTP